MVGRRAYARLHSDERREQLVARATELFATHGYEELSMSRIAREAGISKALLYHYFPSKRQLFATALTAAAEDLRRRTEPQDPVPSGRRPRSGSWKGSARRASGRRRARRCTPGSGSSTARAWTGSSTTATRRSPSCAT